MKAWKAGYCAAIRGFPCKCPECARQEYMKGYLYGMEVKQRMGI